MEYFVFYPIPTQGVQHTEPRVVANLRETDLGLGTLYITESEVLWLNANDEGLKFEYRQINLHAISRDLQAFSEENLLLHYEGDIPGIAITEDELSENEVDEREIIDPETKFREIRFIPENKESLEAMFAALSYCQTLHPDSDCQLSDDEFENADEDGGGDGMFTTEDDISHLTEQGLATLERLNNLQLGGQGDSDLVTRTDSIRILNGHTVDDPNTEDDQFKDADEMND